MHLRHGLITALLVIGTFAPSLHAALPYQPYEVIDIGTLTAKPFSTGLSVSDSSFVAGVGSTGSFQQGFIWRADTGIHWLSHPSGSGETVPIAVNDAGLVIGNSFGPSGGVLWNPDGSVANVLSPAAWDLNNAGQVTGFRNALGSQSAFVWSGGSYTDLGFPSPAITSQGYDINDSGKVAGTLNGGQKFGAFSSAPAAFLWSQAGGFTTIITSSGFQNISVDDLSDQAMMVGVGYSNGGLNRAAWRWNPSNGFAILAGLPSTTTTDARGVNDSGVVVGRSGLFGTVWDQQGNIYKADDLLAPGYSNWNVTSLFGINDDGLLTGEAVLSGNSGTRAVLLRPIPEPTLGGLLLMSCTSLLARRRRAC